MTALNLTAEQRLEIERRIEAATHINSLAGSHAVFLGNACIYSFKDLSRAINRHDTVRAALRRAILESE